VLHRCRDARAQVSERNVPFKELDWADALIDGRVNRHRALQLGSFFPSGWTGAIPTPQP